MLLGRLAQEMPVMVGNGSRGAIIAWQDLRAVTNYDVYAQIVNNAGILGLISIGGTVFNDVEDNGVFDSTDTPLPGWRVTLSGAASAMPVSRFYGPTSRIPHPSLSEPRA